MHITLAQINSSIGDLKHNYDTILSVIERAVKENSTLIVFPELSLCGYLHRDSIEQEGFIAECQRYLELLAAHTPRNIYAVVGLPIADSTADSETDDKNRWIVRNSCVVIHNNAIIHEQAKSVLPNYDIFDEMRYYAPAKKWGMCSIAGRRCGIAICEDVWQAERASDEELSANGLGASRLPLHELDLLIVCSASPYEPDKLERRLAMIQKYCAFFGFDAIYVNSVGGEDGILFDGQSFAVNAKGGITHISPIYQEHHATIDIDQPATAPRRQKEPYADVWASLVFGLREYVHKNGFTRVVFGLSGGIDSALVAVVARAALGAENVHVLLMPSQYSSPASTRDALALIERLGISHSVLSIASLFDSYKGSLHAALSHASADHATDIALQNLQSRIRGTLVMAHANINRALALNTGNKSELAIGYCTQYGDMVGALAVIGDLYKGQVYALAEYINRQREIIPASILAKAPSAELKPDQIDEDDLPPYHILDQILMRYIEERASPKEIIASGIERDVVHFVIRLHHQSEYKRSQAPPVIRVSKKAFGTGRRMLVSRAPFEILP